jgi:8-oxo-dGTP pyrophosphatase MutT (NUDIX family)
MNDYRNPIQVSIYPYRVTSKHEFLLMQRIPHRGGFWQGVSGGVERGENLNIAARRELKEETGFETSVIFINHYFEYAVEKKYKHLYSPTTTKIQDQAYIADVSGLGDPTLSNEHDAFKWLEFKNINLEDLKWQENKTALVKAYEYIFLNLRD